MSLVGVVYLVTLIANNGFVTSLCDNGLLYLLVTLIDDSGGAFWLVSLIGDMNLQHW